MPHNHSGKTLQPGTYLNSSIQKHTPAPGHTARQITKPLLLQKNGAARALNYSRTITLAGTQGRYKLLELFGLRHKSLHSLG